GLAPARAGAGTGPVAGRARRRGLESGPLPGGAATRPCPAPAGCFPMQSAPSSTLSGPRLVRQLAALAGSAADAPVQPLSQLLSQWLEWKQAVALARVLDAAPATADLAPAGDGDAATLVASTRASLAQSLARDRAFAAPPDGPRPPYEWTWFQQRHLALQHLIAS